MFKHRNSIQMMCHYPDRGIIFDWSCCKGNLLQPIRRVVTCHQFKFLQSFHKCHFAGKLLVVSWNVSCFFRLALINKKAIAYFSIPVQSRLFAIQCNNNEGVHRKSPQVCSGALSIQPQISEISVDTANGTAHFGLVRLEYSVLFDQSTVISFGRTEMSLSIWQNFCPQYCFFVFCPQEQWYKARWLGSVLCNRNVPFHWAHVISDISNWNFCWMKAPLIYCYRLLSVYLVCVCESMGD